MSLLTEKDIKEKLKDLSGWIYESNSITKEYKTQNFVNAIGFVVKIGLIAEKMDHHPDINIHSYNKVKITLSTHSAGGVTNNDFELAVKIEAIKV